MSLLNKTQYEAIRSQHGYYSLVRSGYAWEFFPNLQHTWEEFKHAQRLNTAAKVARLRNRKNPFEGVQ